MPPSPSRNHHKDHTVVLASRISQPSRPLILGSKQEHIYPARGSPPRARDHPTLRSMMPPRASEQRPYKEQQTTTVREGDLLVRFGIDTIVGRMVARVLIACMLFQPVYVALGMELEDTVSAVENSVQSEASASTEVREEQQDVLENEALTGAVQPETSTEEVAGVVEGTQGEFDTETEDTEESSDTSEGMNGETTSDEYSSNAYSENEGGIVRDTDTTGTEGSETSATDTVREETNNDTASSTNETASSTEETASTTEETDMLTEDVVATTQNPENRYVFGEGDCTLVSEGEFYCVAEGVERQTTGDSRVYAEKDREGDREIFYFDGVEVRRVTNNSYDDFAPMFDEETMRIVWQAMVQDRLQIMVHDISRNTTRQITTNLENSSNPSIAGDTVVWQEWVDTNWEIMMTDVNNEGQAFVVERLTDNMVHDMFPAAYDGLITWQSERGSSWEVVVYDVRTQKKQTLEKNENTKYENPRFALLFDSKHENGDVETIGYDLDTGEMTELGTKANPQPITPKTPKDEMPEAIPQSTSTTTKEDIEAGNDPVVE